MRVGLVQFDMAWEDKEDSKRRITSILQNISSPEKLDWLIFPEMTLTGFSMDASRTVLDQNDLDFFRGIAVGKGLAVSFGGTLGGQNHCFTYDSTGKALKHYAKMHLFSVAEENKYYRDGSDTISNVISDVHVTPYICYDLRFPYIFWSRGPETDVFFVIASWPATRITHWETLLRARAIENQCYVIGVNRTGRDPKNYYCGSSAVFDPLGSPILECGSRPGIHSCFIDRSLVAKTRATFPFIKDRKGV